MQIRCPQCEYSRNIDEKKIPATSEFATCPKCKRRFRFRVFEKPKAAAPVTPSAPTPQTPAYPAGKSAPQGTTPRDIWDAVDSLHQRWKTEEAVPARVPAQPEQSQPVPPAAATPVAQNAPSAKPLQADSFAPVQHDDSVAVALEDHGAQDEPPVPAKPRKRIVSELVDFDQDLPFVPPAPDRTDTTDQPEQTETRHSTYGNDARERVRLELLDQEPSSEEPESRPLRDLGRLEDSPPWADEPLQIDGQNKRGASGSGVPWENLSTYGPVRGFFMTVQQAMLSPAKLFGGITPTGSLVLPLIFYLILTMFQRIMSQVWVSSLLNMVGEQNQSVAEILPMLGMDNLSNLLLLGPAMMALQQLLVAGFIHLMLLLGSPKQANFAISYKVTAYASAPLILSIVPLYGPGIGLMWSMIVLLVGCRHAYKLSWGKALLGVLPFYLLTILYVMYTFKIILSQVMPV